MMHNPFQSYQTDPTLAAYAGMGNPFSLPYNALQNPLTNPATTLNPLAAAAGVTCPMGASQLGQTGYAGIPNYGSIHPQQLQLSSWLTPQSGIPQGIGSNLAANWQNPYAVSAFQNPWITAGLQNPILAAVLQNQLLTSGLQNPLLTNLQNQLVNPMAAQQHFVQALFGQQGLPYGQFGSPFAQQSPYGQTGSPFGQQSPYGQTGLPFGQQSPYSQIGALFGQQSPYSQIGASFGQQVSPYGQLGSQLAPQSWVGQAGSFGGVQGIGQIHPLVAQQLAQQLGARPFHTPGITPWSGF